MQQIRVKPLTIGLLLKKNEKDFDLEKTQLLKEKRSLKVQEFRTLFALVPSLTLKITNKKFSPNFLLATHFQFFREREMLDESYYFQAANKGPNIVVPHFVLALPEDQPDDWFVGAWKLDAELTFVRDTQFYSARNKLRYLEGLSYRKVAVYRWSILSAPGMVTPTGEFLVPERDDSLMEISVNVDDI